VIKVKKPELRVTIRNPNTPEDTQELLAQRYAMLMMQIRQNNAGKTIDEILGTKGETA